MGSRLTKKILLVIFVWSTMVTLITTMLQLWYNYKRDIDFLSQQVLQVESSSASSLAKFMWEMDDVSIQLHLEGVLKTPGIAGVQISEHDKVSFSAGNKGNSASATHPIPLIYTSSEAEDQNQGKHDVGTLEIITDGDYALARLRQMAFEIFLTQLLRTLAITTLIFFSIQRMITSPMLKMTAYLKSINPGTNAKPLAVERAEKKFLPGPDEIDEMAVAINLLRENLYRSYSNLQEFNQSLEQRVHERTTELVDAQKVVVQQQQALATSSKLSALGEMAGGVAHEINNPLAIIKMKCQQLIRMISSEKVESSTLVQNLEKMDQTVERIAKIISGLKSFSRSASSDPLESVLVNSIIESTLSFCQEKFRNQSIEIRYYPEKSAHIFLQCRPTEISQILLNFLNNSNDAVLALPEKWIEIGALELQDRIQISVTDSGHGIPERVREKLMQPFFTTKAVGVGTGLGLSISLGLARSQGGTLFLDENSKNTRFIVEFLKTPKKLYLRKSN